MKRRKLSPAPAETPAGGAMTPDLIAELLDPESWGKVLGLYAGTMRLAVAFIDPEGRLVGTCHNAQPIWSLAHAAKLEWGGACPFCLDLEGRCTAAADAVRTNSVVLTHDPAGLAHVALALTLGGQHIGTLLAGQVFDRYPEPLPLDRLARDFEVSPQQVWQLARLQAPISRTNLAVYGDLLRTLGHAFLRERHGAILERKLTETNKRFNAELEAVNIQLKREVEERDRANSDLENLIESTEIATIFLDRELRIKRFTPAVANLMRLKAGDIGRQVTDLGGRFAEAGLVESMAEVVRTLSIGTWQEYPVVRATGPDGAQQHHLMRILPYRRVNRVIDGVVITFTDVTESKEAERLAEQARVYAEDIVATVREPLLVLDSKLCVKSANAAFYEKFHVNADETTGEPLFELGDGQWDHPVFRRLLEDLLPRNQKVEDLEVEHDFPRLGRRTMLLNARRIDSVDLILLAIEDITEHKKAEDLARSVSLDMKHFLYAVSHDLQEPLRMMMSYTQLLARQYKSQLDPQAGQFLEYAMEGARRMDGLLRDLRAYWLVQERKLEPGAEVDCGRVLEKAIQTLRVPIGESGAEITHSPLPTIVAEDVSLEMLFQNLVGNAIKYRHVDQSPRVHVSASQDAGVWRFSVQDNGIGIRAEHLQEVFAPFKRLHANDYPGTGLGLALCHKIVEHYGGRLWVESVYGSGSTFHFTIPG